LFWRVGNPKVARLLHRSPLMDIPGVGMDTYAVDILHTWHFGRHSKICRQSFVGPSPQRCSCGWFAT
jgi:hypothetical protein